MTRTNSRRAAAAEATSRLRKGIVMSFACVECHRAIINRRIATCQFCGAAIPPHLLFDQRTAAKLAALDAAEAEKTP